jgi:hypothetical protein
MGGRILSTEVQPLDRGADRDETACSEEPWCEDGPRDLPKALFAKLCK